MEFLNKWRHAEKYPANDSFAPAHYDFDYLFAITMAAQPLAWMEAANLPQEAFALATLMSQYKTIQHAFHQGIILPIGEEPSGRAWTGFQSMTSETTGYFIVYREDNQRPQAELSTYLTKGATIGLELIAGRGSSFKAHTDDEGRLLFKLPQKNQFAIYKYTIIK